MTETLFLMWRMVAMVIVAALFCGALWFVWLRWFPPPRVEAEQITPSWEVQRWQMAYEQFILLAQYKGGLVSAKQMIPHYRDHGREYWQWMAHQLRQNGIAYLDPSDRRRTTRIAAGQGDKLRNRVMELVEAGRLRPHPTLPPPDIRLLAGAGNTVNTANTVNTIGDYYHE